MLQTSPIARRFFSFLRGSTTTTLITGGRFGTAAQTVSPIVSALATPMSTSTITNSSNIDDQNPLNTITADSKCAGCSSFEAAMNADEADQQRAILIPSWTLSDDGIRISKSLKFKNFAAALDYVNKIGQIAEAENHHPDLTIRSYNHVDIQLWTHAVKGLTTNDFILAVKIDTIGQHSLKK